LNALYVDHEDKSPKLFALFKKKKNFSPIPENNQDWKNQFVTSKKRVSEN